MTKEKRLIATNKTEEQRDRLTEVWKRRIVVEKGYPETIAERIANRVKALADYMQYGHAIIAFYKQNGNFQLVTGTLISYLITESFATLTICSRCIVLLSFGAWKKKDGEAFR